MIEYAYGNLSLAIFLGHHIIYIYIYIYILANHAFKVALVCRTVDVATSTVQLYGYIHVH